MATVIMMESGRLGYTSMVNTVVRFGQRRSPRGLVTYDVGHVVVHVDTPYDALPIGTGRQLNAAIGAAEAVQLVAGQAQHALLPRISPVFGRFAEPESGRFHGAYGDRIGQQVAAVVRKINADRDTRQAVITLWDPSHDNEPERRDYPCTVALNFAVVNDLLELRTMMRSNDVWLGFPYDVFQFTQLQLTVARALRIEPGHYTHAAWSLHIYAEHADLAAQLTEPALIAPFQPTGFGLVNATWDECQTNALAILHGAPPFDRTPSEDWYVEQLRPYTAQHAS